MGPEARMLLRQRREKQGEQNKSSSSSEADTEPVVIRRKPKKKSFPQRRGMTLALTSGVFAALAGTFGKLAINEEETILLCQNVFNNYLSTAPHTAFPMCDKASVYLRVLAFVSMILLNTVMWTTFVKALRYCSTSLEATVTNTAANFFSSAIVGQLIFDESVNWMWCIGTILIVFGLVLMNYGGGKGAVQARRKRLKNR